MTILIGLSKMGGLAKMVDLANMSQPLLVESDPSKRNDFIRRYHLEKLVYLENVGDALAAITRETEVRNWQRCRIDCLIASRNPQWEAVKSGTLMHS